jgi:hypothetical protein
MPEEGDLDMAGITAGGHRETPGRLLRFFDWYSGIVNGRGEKVESMNAHKRDLDRRLDSMGWGLLFLFFAALALPTGPTEYAGVAALGALMLLLNALRILSEIPVRWFSVILGSVMLVGGGGALVGFRMDLWVLFFVLAGFITIVGALIPGRPATASKS